MKDWIKRHRMLAAIVALICLVTFRASWDWMAYHRGRLTAQIDWWRGKPETKHYGRGTVYEDEYARILQEEYGVNLNRVAGCGISPDLLAFAKGYNSVIEEHLRTKYSEDVFEKCRYQARVKRQYEDGEFWEMISGKEAEILTEKSIGPLRHEAWSVPGLGMEMVFVQAGTFYMGSRANQHHHNEDEFRHRVRISAPFWIGKYEVTLAEYRRFLQVTGYTKGVNWDLDECPYEKRENYPLTDNEFAKHKRQPVVMVSWYCALAFCRWLTYRERQADRLPEGYVYRLPTEAEWEYAARGGSKSENRLKYSGSDNIEEVAWYKKNSSRTHPVGQKKPNAVGTYDMSGNVLEWCFDVYKKDYYRECPRSDPVNTTGKRYPHTPYRMVRGGSWFEYPLKCRTANRSYYHSPGNADHDLGFRVVVAPALEDEHFLFQ